MAAEAATGGVLSTNTSILRQRRIELPTGQVSNPTTVSFLAFVVSVFLDLCSGIKTIRREPGGLGFEKKRRSGGASSKLSKDTLKIFLRYSRSWYASSRGRSMATGDKT